MNNNLEIILNVKNFFNDIVCDVYIHDDVVPYAYDKAFQNTEETKAVFFCIDDIIDKHPNTNILVYTNSTKACEKAISYYNNKNLNSFIVVTFLNEEQLEVLRRITTAVVSVDAAFHKSAERGCYVYHINDGFDSYFDVRIDLATSKGEIELIACLNALQHIEEGKNVIICTSSDYIINSLRYMKEWKARNWRRMHGNYPSKRICNYYAWHALDEYIQFKFNSVTFKHIDADSNLRETFVYRKMLNKALADIDREDKEIRASW